MTTTTTSPNTTPILNSWDDAAVVMQALSAAQARLDAEQALFQQRLSKLQQEHDARTALDRATVEAASRDLAEFATAHRKDFGVAKSRKVGAGRVGWRASSALAYTVPAETVIERLRTLRPDLVRTTVVHDPDKVRIRALPPAELASLGCEVKTTETFYVEVAPAAPKTDRIVVTP